MSSTEPPPNFPNGSIFKYSYIELKSAFRSLIPNLRSVLESTSLVTKRTPTMPNLSSVNRMSLFHRRSISSDSLLPVYVVSDHNLVESSSDHTNTPTRHGKTMLSLTLQTVLTLAPTSSSGNSLSYSVPAMVIAFTAFFISILLCDAFPRAARTLDKVASAFSVVGFFLMTNAILLPCHFKWIGWLALALCMLASIKSLV